MSAPASSWLVSRRAMVVYLGTIVTPGLALIFLGIQNVRQQQTALESLTNTSQRLSVERFVHEAERRVLAQADTCLDAVEQSAAVSLARGGDDPYTQRKVRTTLQSIIQQHPIASAIFLFRAGSLRFPLLRSPLPRSSESLAAGEPPARRAALVRLLRRAESAEVGQLGLSSALYGNVYEQAETAPLKALALARRARSASRARDCATAERLFRRLASEFPDEYDPFGRPYALSSWLYLSDGTAACPPQSTEARSRLVPLLRQVPAGQWELSAELASYYVADLEQRTGDPLPAVAPYLQQFAVAEAFSRVVARYGSLMPGEIHAEAVLAAGAPWQVVYQRPHEDRTADTQAIVAVVVNLDWVRAALLPSVAGSLGVLPPVIGSAPDKPPPAAPGPGVGLRVPFREVFPFWEVTPAPAAVESSQATIRRGAWVLGGSMVVVLGMLAGGVLLLARDARRETEVSAVKAGFVSGVSHELKTPLTVIRLYAETLSADPLAAVEERQGYYDIITHESARLTALIDKVLDFSRIERGQKTYHLGAGDLRGVVEHTIQTYQDYLRRRGFHFECDLEPPPPVFFDGDAVAEALVNLLDNAVKYSDQVRWIRVRLGARGRDAVLEVQDQGVGIAGPERERIFAQFFRGRHSGAGGYGLGLFLVKHIMDAHDGLIEVESAPGRGSLFRLVFPGAEGPPRQPAGVPHLSGIPRGSEAATCQKS